MNPLIQLTFKSDTPTQVYNLFVHSLEDSIKLNFDDPDKLKEIRLQLMESLAIVEHLQFSNKSKGWY